MRNQDEMVFGTNTDAIDYSTYATAFQLDDWHNPRYRVALRQQTLQILKDATHVPNRGLRFDQIGVNIFRVPIYFIATILLLAKDGEIIVPSSINLDWDGNFMTVGRFARNVVQSYSLR
jgi:hypothetical protein